MLLQTFNKEERIAFAELAKQMIAVDKVFDQRELQMYEDICAEMNIDESDVYKMDNVDIKDLLDVFSNDNKQIFAILELLSIAFIDENYAIEEQQMMCEMIEHLEIDEEKLKEMQQWAKQRIKLGRMLIDILD